MNLDILVVAPHPDDAELWCGGYILKAVSQGHKVGILDLTLGELSSNGTPKLRVEEIKAASKILKLAYRGNLKIPDGGINQNEEKQIKALVKSYRELQPKLILAPYFIERHPDHEATSKLAQKAFFFSGLAKYNPKLGKPFTPSSLIFYQLRVGFEPSFLVDISEQYSAKISAINAFKSQIGGDSKQRTLLNNPLTLKAIEARDSYFGAKLGVKYAEAYYSRSAIGLTDPLKALCNGSKPQFFS